jgi:hypothetical protein
VEDEKEENVHACFPLVFELVEHIGLGRENAMKMKKVSVAESTKGGEVSRAQSSGSTKAEEVSGAQPSGSTKGGEVSRAQSSGSTKAEKVSGAQPSGSTKGGEVSRAQSSGSTKAEEVSGAQPNGFTQGGKVSGAQSSGSTEGGEVSGAQSSGSTEGETISGAQSSGSTKGETVSGAQSSGSTKGETISGAQFTGSTEGETISSAQSTGFSRQQSSNEEREEKFNDPPINHPNPNDPTRSIDPQEERIFTVKVFPRPKELSIALKGQQEPPKISPMLVFEFQQGASRMITTKIITVCDFGSLEEPIKNDFGFYQDNITICLKCMDDVVLNVTETNVQDVQYVKKTMADTSTTTKNSGYNVGPTLGGTLQINYHVEAHADVNFVYKKSGGASNAHGSTGEISFRQLDCFFVHDEGSNNKLQYNFRYPQNVLQEIASSDLSDFKANDTFRPIIVGNWENLNENETNEYVFNVKRHIISEANLRDSFKFVGNPPLTQKYFVVNFNKSTDTRVPINDTTEDPPLTIQCYEVTLWVNHKMNNLPHKVPTMSLSENNMTIPRVMGIEKRSTSHTT